MNKTQLFDLRDDPAEMHDLAADPQHADDVARLTARLQAEQKLVDDKLPLTTAEPQPLEFDFTKVKRNPKAAIGE